MRYLSEEHAPMQSLRILTWVVDGLKPGGGGPTGGCPGNRK